jgi:hypothetical protein
MAYLGNAPARSFISFERQVFTIVNSQTAYTLDHSVNNENDLRLVINNIVQEPGSGKAYTASGTTLTLSAALTNGTDEMYCVFLGRATATNAPGAGSVGTSQLASDAVTEAKIADDAVESEHLNNNVISGQTALGATPADTDEFLVSDAGTIKRVDYSYIKGGTMTPSFEANANAQTGITDATPTKVDFANELYDSDSCYDTSNKRFLPTTAGKYYIYAFSTFDAQGTDKFHSCYLSIYKNGSYYKQAYFDEYDNYLAYSKTPFVGATVDFNGSSDYVEIYATFNITSGTNHRLTGGAYSAFGGYKIIGA